MYITYIDHTAITYIGHTTITGILFTDTKCSCSWRVFTLQNAFGINAKLPTSHIQQMQMKTILVK